MDINHIHKYKDTTEMNAKKYAFLALESFEFKMIFEWQSISH